MILFERFKTFISLYILKRLYKTHPYPTRIEDFGKGKRIKLSENQTP